MPWRATDASSKTKKATTKSKKDTWSRVANKVLKNTGDEARAIKIANAVLKKRDRDEDDYD